MCYVDALKSEAIQGSIAMAPEDVSPSQLGFATFDAAWRAASRFARDHECRYLIKIERNGPRRYRLEEDRGQGGAIAAVTADPREGLCLTRAQRIIVPIPSPTLAAANDR